jgi:hypothetical protein
MGSFLYMRELEDNKCLRMGSFLYMRELEDNKCDDDQDHELCARHHAKFIGSGGRGV